MTRLADIAVIKGDKEAVQQLRVVKKAFVHRPKDTVNDKERILNKLQKKIAKNILKVQDLKRAIEEDKPQGLDIAPMEGLVQKVMKRLEYNRETENRLKTQIYHMYK